MMRERRTDASVAMDEHSMSLTKLRLDERDGREEMNEDIFIWSVVDVHLIVN